MRPKNENKKKRITLDQISKKNFQQVPEGYFDQLPSMIQTKIDEESKVKTPVFTVGFNWQTASIAAAVVLILVFSGVFNTVDSSRSVEDILAEVSVDDIIDYLDYSEISTSEIVAELDIDEADIDAFLENDIQLLNSEEFENMDELDLYQEFGIDESVY